MHDRWESQSIERRLPPSSERPETQWNEARPSLLSCGVSHDRFGLEMMMPTTIFHTDDGRIEPWLEVNANGTVTYFEENSGQRMLRRGIEPRSRVMTADEAKLDWISYADEIAEAVATIACHNHSPSGRGTTHPAAEFVGTSKKSNPIPTAPIR